MKTIKTYDATKKGQERYPVIKGEEWKWIEGYEGLYKVSNYGRVKSFIGEPNKEHGKFIFHERVNDEGYAQVALSKNGKVTEKRVGRLVCYHFNGAPEGDRITVNHIDGVKLHDYAENLEWANHSEQLYHAYRLGLRKPTRGIRSLSKEKQLELIEEYQPGPGGVTLAELGERFGISRGTAWNILKAHNVPRDKDEWLKWKNERNK